MNTRRSITLGAAVRETGGKIQTGPFGSQLHASDYVAVGTPLVMPTNLGDNTIREDGIARVGKDDLRRLSGHQLRAGDIVFSRRGDVGRRAIVRQEQAGWLCGTGCLAVRFGKDLSHVNPEYVAHYVGAARPQTWLVDNAVGGTMLNLNTSILGALPLLLPSREEQDAAVSAIDSAAGVERALVRLISKTRTMRQGMMQELLTGRTRLPGFVRHWREVRLGALGNFLKGRGVKRDEVRSSGVPCIRYGELYATYSNYTAHTVSFVDPSVAAQALPIRSGDVLFAASGETKTEIGTNVAYVGDVPAVAGGDIVVLRGDSYDPVFLATLLNTPAIAVQKARVGQGDAVVHLNARNLAEIRITLPQIDEQRAIADVLADLDDEIAALGRRLESARAIKQGMMQELLTGRARLSVGEDAE